MAFTRRDFVKGGVAAFTWGFAAPAFLSDVAHAQGAASRNLVVLYLGGGNDSLNTVVPYGDAFYYSRRPTIAIPPGIGAADRQRRRRPTPSACTRTWPASAASSIRAAWP